MDYERIEKPQAGGGFSPNKLRRMLLGMDKKRKGEEHNEEMFQSQINRSINYESGGSGSDNCKDVDVVSELPECSTSTTADSFPVPMAGDHRIKDHSLFNSRIRSQDDSSLDYDSGHDSTSVSSSIFDFQKTDRAPPRVPVGPFSKPAPSKWDDAQKWIASPTTNKPKTGQALAPAGSGVGARKVGYLARQSSAKVVLEVPDQRMMAFDEPDTKRIDTSQAKKESGTQKFVNWVMDPYPDSYGKPVLMIENSIAETAINLSCHDSSATICTATTFMPPPSTARSVSMRDMGTEMTPIASQEPSRTGTPVRATTPIRSPNSSRSSTPPRTAPVSSPINSLVNSNKELSEKELQMKTRREIMALGTQLGKMNIAAWASKEEEDKDASTSLKNMATTDLPTKNAVEARAAAWEAAEKAKYMARFKREEMKIQAWENHQKAKTEAEMRKIEVEVERMRGRAQDKLMNKLAAARHKAEEKRASAEAKRNRQAAKTEQQADFIRKTGRIPSSFSCFGCSTSFSFCGWCK